MNILSPWSVCFIISVVVHCITHHFTTGILEERYKASEVLFERLFFTYYASTGWMFGSIAFMLISIGVRNL